MKTVFENLAKIRQSIAVACSRSNRNPADIEIVAVSKTVSSALVEVAIQAGVKHIGENRVQEAAKKKPEVQAFAHWHMIGHLQTNKVRKALEFFDVIQSVDSFHLAEKLHFQCENLGRSVDIFLQVNTSGEESKFGIEPEKTFSLLEQIVDFPNLKVKGLMTIGPFTSDKTKIRRSFSLLRKIFQEIAAAGLPGVEMKYLSMGMSDDFEIAVEEGANMLRLGRAIFGERA